MAFHKAYIDARKLTVMPTLRNAQEMSTLQRAADKAADTRAERYGETRHMGDSKQ
jgi:hypothetical protein